MCLTHEAHICAKSFLKVKNDCGNLSHQSDEGQKKNHTMLSSDTEKLLRKVHTKAHIHLGLCNQSHFSTHWGQWKASQPSKHPQRPAADSTLTAGKFLLGWRLAEQGRSLSVSVPQHWKPWLTH